MFRVQYYCPREAPLWQDLTTMLFFARTFATQIEAEREANSLIWRYHAARVIDPWGRVVYQV
jgi:hypothetical protein